MPLDYVDVGVNELEVLQDFLKLNGLPYHDIQLAENRFLLYYDRGVLVGTGGLEFYGDCCLLRSVAVAPEFRGKGYGKEIVNDLVERANDRPVWNVSLLTETAESFFQSLGFIKKVRDEAPGQIKSSSEFSSVCPVSAHYMEKVLRTPRS